MPVSARFCLVLAIFLFGLHAMTCGQDQEEARPLEPRRPVTKRDLDRREALKLYASGLICQRQDRLLEATRLFEKALTLDPDAAPIHKALIPLYLALERDADALTACRKVVELDAEDYETWLLYGRQLKAMGRTREAIAALARGVSCKKLGAHPELLQQMYFELGSLYEVNHDYLKAAKAFIETAKILEKPESIMRSGAITREDVDARATELYERLGRIYTQARKYDDAVAAYKKAQAKARDRAGRLSFNLADVYRAQGKLDDALTCLDAYLQLQPQGMEAYEMKIALLRKLGRARDIVPALESYARTDRFNAPLKLILAREYMGQGQSDRAERIYKELARSTPSVDVYRGLFTLYKNAEPKGMAKVLGILDEDLKAAGAKEDTPEKTAAAARGRVMLAVLRDDPTLVKPLLKTAQQQLRANGNLAFPTLRFLAVLAGHAKQLEIAEELYRECLARHNNDAAVYYGLLQVLWQGRKHKAIIDVCEMGLAKTDVNAHFLFHLDLSEALAHLDDKDNDKKAIAHADQAVALAGENNRRFVRLRRVAVLTRLEKYERAIKDCLAMLKEYQQPADVHDIRYSLANVYTAARLYPQAEKALARLIEDHPEDATAYNDLGYIWADRSKNLNKAEEYIRKAIELDRKQKKTGAVVGTEEDRDNAAYVDSLGWVLFRRGQLEAARKALEKASALPGGDDDPVVFDHLGDVYFRLDQPERARAAWRRAQILYEVEKRRKMDRRYDEIKEKLRDLKPETQP
jgi:tetratricopeptide (TPR) repeat protein